MYVYFCTTNKSGGGRTTAGASKKYILVAVYHAYSGEQNVVLILTATRYHTGLLLAVYNRVQPTKAAACEVFYEYINFFRYSHESHPRWYCYYYNVVCSYQQKCTRCTAVLYNQQERRRASDGGRARKYLVIHPGSGISISYVHRRTERSINTHSNQVRGTVLVVPATATVYNRV